MNAQDTRSSPEAAPRAVAWGPPNGVILPVGAVRGREG
jgi:hypothetical protein